LSSSVSRVLDVKMLPVYRRERRQKIIDVALGLLLKHGGAVDVLDVANAGETSLATIYRYFGSKEVLFAMAYLHWHSGLVPAFEASMKRARTNSGRMRAGANAMYDAFEQAPHMWDLYLLTRSLKEPAVLSMRLEFEQRLKDLYKGALQGISGRDADGIIAMLIALTAWNLSSWRTGDISTQQLRDELNEAIRLTVDGR
jgi:TetR/AcrR family transcriptional regulator, cholesterol catabolism regulator